MPRLHPSPTLGVLQYGKESPAFAEIRALLSTRNYHPVLGRASSFRQTHGAGNGRIRGVTRLCKRSSWSMASRLPAGVRAPSLTTAVFMMRRLWLRYGSANRNLHKCASNCALAVRSTAVCSVCDASMASKSAAAEVWPHKEAILAPWCSLLPTSINSKQIADEEWHALRRSFTHQFGAPFLPHPETGHAGNQARTSSPRGPEWTCQSPLSPLVAPAAWTLASATPLARQKKLALLGAGRRSSILAYAVHFVSRRQGSLDSSTPIRQDCLPVLRLSSSRRASWLVFSVHGHSNCHSNFAASLQQTGFSASCFDAQQGRGARFQEHLFEQIGWGAILLFRSPARRPMPLPRLSLQPLKTSRRRDGASARRGEITASCPRERSTEGQTVTRNHPASTLWGIGGDAFQKWISVTSESAGLTIRSQLGHFIAHAATFGNHMLRQKCRRPDMAAWSTAFNCEHPIGSIGQVQVSDSMDKFKACGFTTESQERLIAWPIP